MLEDLNSLKFWNLIEQPEVKQKDEVNDITKFEKSQREKKNKFNHKLPINHALLAVKDFVQYFHKNHQKNLEYNFVILAKKDVTETEKDIYITQQSL